MYIMNNWYNSISLFQNKLNTLPDSFVLNNTKKQVHSHMALIFPWQLIQQFPLQLIEHFPWQLIEHFLTVKRTFNQIHCISQIRTFSPDNSLSLTTLWTLLLKDHWTYFLTDHWTFPQAAHQTISRQLIEYSTWTICFSQNKTLPPWQFIEQFFWQIIIHFYHWTLSLTAY